MLVRTMRRWRSSAISGSGIDWHDMDSYFRPNGIGKYSFVGDNEIVFNKPGRQFDAVGWQSLCLAKRHAADGGQWQLHAAGRRLCSAFLEIAG